jgi:hypothetical protein
MTTPNSFIDLLMLQAPEQRLNALLEKYLMHHPDSPAREVVEKAIASPDARYKLQVLEIVLMYD